MEDPRQKANREKINSVLRQVDEAIKRRDLETALRLVKEVFELDAKNSYAHAFEERIVALRAEREAGEAEAARKAAEKKNIPPQRLEPVSDYSEADMEFRRKSEEFAEVQRQKEVKQKERALQEENLEQRARKASVEERKELLEADLVFVESEMAKRMQELERRIAQQIGHALEVERLKLDEDSNKRFSEFLASINQRQITPGKQEGAANIEQLRLDYEQRLVMFREQLAKDMRDKLEAERQKIREATFKEVEEGYRLAQNELLQRMEAERQEAIVNERNRAKERALKAVENLMLLMMELRLPKQVQEPLLSACTLSLGISEHELEEVSRTVRVNKYIEAVRTAWKSGQQPSAEELTLLKNLQRLYNITEEEHFLIMKRIKRELGLPDETAVIAVVDDERYIIEFMVHILKQTYHSVLAATSVEEMELLIAKQAPSVIISDVRLPAPGVGGFTFFERLREGKYGEELKDVPFVLMSAIADEFFIKTAERLGVKAYLIKPFTKETLEETVRNILQG